MTTYTPEEQRAHRQALVAALRSGEYEQGVKRLRTEIKGRSHFCCLGVACEISGLGKWTMFRTPQWVYLTDEGQSNWANLPQDVNHYYGFRTIYGGGASNNLTKLNDTGWSFAAIADLIESEPEGLIAKG